MERPRRLGCVAPVCSTTAARSVEARAASHQRSQAVIDLIPAYHVEATFHPPTEVLDLFVGVTSLPWNMEYMTTPVLLVVMELYGVMRCGF